jgi:hypothetical protein
MPIVINGSGTITGASTLATAVVSPTLTTPVVTSTLGVGNATPSASGAGITFPATQSASSDANTLDDYEEGTWTPTISFGGGSVGLTYQAQNGRYTKIGNTVTVQCGLYLNQKGSSTGTAVVGGLPFATPNQGFGSYGGTLLNSRANMAAGAIGVPYIVVNENGTQVYLYQVISGSETQITDTYFNNSAYIQFACTYRTT